MEQQTAIAQGAARSWYFFILLTQAFFIPAASAFLSSKKIAGEVQSGAFQILRSSRASSISIVVSKYTSSVAVLMPFSIGLTGLYLAIVGWISSSVDYKLALLVISQIVFFTFYYNLLDIFISSISSSVLAATLASILLSYNFIIMGALLPETLQGQKLTTEYYWGRIMAYLEGREIIAWTEVQNAIILVSVVLGLLIVGSLLVVRKRQA